MSEIATLPDISDADKTNHNEWWSMLVGWVRLLWEDIMSWDIRPQIINELDWTRIPLTREDIKILLQAIYRAEHNPASDKLTSDRVITRLYQDIGFSEYRKERVNDIIYITEFSISLDRWHTEVNMEIFDADWNPKGEIIDQIYELLQKK